MGPENQLIALKPENNFNTSIEVLRTELAEFKAFEVTDPTDETQLRKLDLGLRALQKIRTSITSSGKAWREASNAYNKAVIALEKQLLSEVVPTEERYKLMQHGIESEKKLKANSAKLFDRVAALKENSIVLDNYDMLMTMDDDQFDTMVKAYKLKASVETIPVDGATQEKMDNVATVAADALYEKWLRDNYYDPKTDYVAVSSGKTRTLYRAISTYSIS